MPTSRWTGAGTEVEKERTQYGVRADHLKIFGSVVAPAGLVGTRAQLPEGRTPGAGA
jgi:hypothetical protein